MYFKSNSPFDVMKHSQKDYAIKNTITTNTKPQENTKPQNDKFINTSTENNISTNENSENVIDTVTKPNQTKKQRIRSAIIIGSSVATLGTLTLALTKGKVSKKTTDAIQKLMDKITKKTEQIKDKPTISKLEGMYLSGLQKTNKIMFMIRGAIFNLSPLKDVLFDKFVRQKCGLKKPCDAITNWFKDLSFATVKSSYKKASKSIDKMSQTFENVNARLLSHGPQGIHGAKPFTKEQLLEITKRTENIRNAFDTHFVPSQLEKRSEDLVKNLDGLGNKVYDRIYGNMKGFVTDVNAWTSFVPEELIAKDKAKIMASLADKRRIITNNPTNNFDNMNAILNNLDAVINPKDKNSRKFVKALKDLSKRYVTASGSDENIIREEISKTINATLKHARLISESKTYTPEENKKIMSLLRNFGKIINTDKKGDIEEILTIYRQILPPKEYEKVKKVALKTIKDLNKAVHNEGFEYVDKVRDLATGSALTDVAIGTAVPVISTGIAISTAKTKEKKRSVGLKYGVPLLVGIATTMISTVKLVSGGKSLMLGAFTGAAANEICEHIDNYLKKKSKPDNQQNTEIKTNTNKKTGN